MKEDPEDFLQLAQWHRTVVDGEPVIVYVIDPQRQEPLVTSVASAFKAGLERSSAAIGKGGLSFVLCSHLLWTVQ
jgi:hypothetical protein